MRVMKFGGAVLLSPDGFRQMAEILLRQQGSPCLVVVSAFSSTTRDLEFTTRLALQGALAEALERLTHVVDDHRQLVRALIDDVATRDALATLLDDCYASTSRLLTGISITRQRSPRILDEVLAVGEFMALHIARHVLGAAGLSTMSADATTVMVTTDDFGKAVPLIPPTTLRARRILRPLLEHHDVVMVQGFVGQTESGVTTTMGKESSNLTATVLGAALEADEIVIWTNVAGLRTGDPDVCTNTVVVPSLSWQEALETAHAGVKVLYPTMIEPAAAANIPIRIAHASFPDGEQTLLGVPGPTPLPIVVLAEATDDVHHACITTVFAPRQEWLRTITTVIDEHNVGNAFSCSTSESSATSLLCVPASVARSSAQSIHNLLVHHTNETGS